MSQNTGVIKQDGNHISITSTIQVHPAIRQDSVRHRPCVDRRGYPGAFIPPNNQGAIPPNCPFSPPPFPHFPLPLPLPPLHSSPTAKRPPWNQLRGLGCASSPVWSGAKPQPTPADIVFAFWCILRGKTHLTAIIIWIFIYWNLLSF